MEVVSRSEDRHKRGAREADSVGKEMVTSEVSAVASVVRVWGVKSAAGAAASKPRNDDRLASSRYMEFSLSEPAPGGG